MGCGLTKKGNKMSSYTKLLKHVGHNIVVAYYGEMPKPENIAIECEDCHEVLIDYDCELEETTE